MTYKWNCPIFFLSESIEKIVIIDMAPKLLKSADWSFGLAGVFSRKPGDFGHEDNLYLLSVMLDNWEAYSKIVAQRILNKSLYNEKILKGRRLGVDRIMAQYQ